MLTGICKAGLLALLLTGAAIVDSGRTQAQERPQQVERESSQVLHHPRARKAKKQAECERKAKQQAKRMRKAKQQAERARKAKQQAKRKRTARQ